MDYGENCQYGEPSTSENHHHCPNVDPYDCHFGPLKRSHPHDCFKYILCIKEPRELPVVLDCWPGLAFDPYTEECIFEWLVEDKCVYGIFPTTEGYDSTVTTDVTTTVEETTLLMTTIFGMFIYCWITLVTSK